MSIAPSLDSIAEFRQLTSNYSADYGLSSGGTMTMVLKSGTKQFHAAAWEFNRNDAFDARFTPIARATPRNFESSISLASTLVVLAHVWKLQNPDIIFSFANMSLAQYINGNNLQQLEPDTSTYGGDFSNALPNI